jgi:hypothetical protein
MAAIRAQSTGEMRILEPEHLVGRGPLCPLRLDEPYVSAQHATLRWSSEGWVVKDLGSRNGTFHNDRRLRVGEECALVNGSRIAFGKADQQWVVVDDSPPLVMAVPVAGGDPVVLEGDLMPLPSGDDPRVTIYRAEGAWVVEHDDGRIAFVANLQVFDVAGRLWRFCSPDGAAATCLGPDLAIHDVRLAFSVSRDEEHVELRVNCRGTTFDLGARNHNYLLLTLARRRLADAARGFVEADCGWIGQDEFAHDPSMAPPQLNVDVFRIRKQFAVTGAPDVARIIERDPRMRKLRLGTGHVSITIL